ncbi:MAG TPA: LptF/LptG family permease, partial [Verrucomicrobiae bacterium]|nr:LptF/LptG family permease [Verrucomicrobiae bacterium]
QSGTWDGEKWTFQGVTEYQMDSQGKILGEPRKFPAKTYPDLKVTPRDLTSSSSESTFLSYRELKHSVQKLKENGINVDSEKVELHYRLAAPWQGLVMMLVAVPILAPTRNRKAIAGSILLCIGLVFIYHVMGAISLALGKAGKIFPFLSAWAGNIVFAIGALFMLDRANH